MRCINKHKVLISIVLLSSIFLGGCNSASYEMPYSSDNTNSVAGTQLLETFSSNLCVVGSDIPKEGITMSNNSCAGLFDLNKKETLYAVNVNERINPASLTKIMTALVALKYGSLDKVLTASSNVNISESGAQLIGLSKGDTMTLDQALHLLLIYSANDAAELIAENIGGSEDSFVEMMNQEARSIGAVGCNFRNPHGLTAENHYVTAYDMYLIFNEAMKYDTFQEIINMGVYSTTYTKADGSGKKVDIKSTNAFLRGDRKAPTNITVIGGKTGSTNAAGHCLILLAKDSSGNPYIAVVMRAEDTDTLYNEMTQLLASCAEQ